MTTLLGFFKVVLLFLTLAATAMFVCAIVTRDKRYMDAGLQLGILPIIYASLPAIASVYLGIVFAVRRIKSGRGK